MNIPLKSATLPDQIGQEGNLIKITGKAGCNFIVFRNAKHKTLSFKFRVLLMPQKMSYEIL